LIRQASSFVDLGVKVKKTLAKSITDQAGIETDS
jgi:DNA recombination protein RmuC